MNIILSELAFYFIHRENVFFSAIMSVGIKKIIHENADSYVNFEKVLQM